MVDLVERLFVGGPWDGRREQVSRAATSVVARTVGPVIYATEDAASRFDTDYLQTRYRLHKAPTGEHVFFADGAQWNEHVDTEAWPRLLVAGHQTWTKLGPWFWVGTSVDETLDPPPSWWHRDLRHYVMADVSRSPDWLWVVHPLPEDVCREVQFDVQAHIARDLRQAIDYELLPLCPREGCTEKVICKMIVPIHEEWRFFGIEPTPFRPGLDRIEQLCGEHASELRRTRYDVRTYREEP